MSSIGGFDNLYNQPLTFGTDYYKLDNVPLLDYSDGLFSPGTMPSYDFGTYGTPSQYDFSKSIFGDVGESSNTGSTFEKFLQNLGNNLFNNPLSTARRAGDQLANNLRAGATEAAFAGQALGIRGQLLGTGASLVGEDAQLNRETNAELRAQQLNQTNLAKQNKAQNFKSGLAGKLSPMSIARYSNMIYGV